MSSLLRSGTAICSLAFSTGAFACVASENFDIYFSKDSATVPASETLRLANWVVDQKLRYASHTAPEETLISGHAEDDERHAADLARARLKEGLRLMGSLGFLRGTVRTGAQIYPRGLAGNGKRVEISFDPECPNNCCTADHVGPNSPGVGR